MTDSIPASSLVLDAAEMAALLRISKWKLYRDVREGRLPPELHPLPIGNPLRWSKAAVLHALSLYEEPSPGGTGPDAR